MIDDVPVKTMQPTRTDGKPPGDKGDGPALEKIGTEASRAARVRILQVTMRDWELTREPRGA